MFIVEMATTSIESNGQNSALTRHFQSIEYVADGVFS